LLTDYCAVDDLKGKVLQEIPADDEAFDDELGECITVGNALADAFLKREGLTVPVVVPEFVKFAAAYFAAWEFRRRRDPNAAEIYWNAAVNNYLQVYIDGEKTPYVGGV